jgi:replicative DNA helicase
LNIKKQEHLLGILLSSDDVFSRCVSIIKPEYFDGDLRRVVRFVLDYFEKYKSPPDPQTIESEIEISIEKQTVTRDKVSYACEEIEKYCKESAVAVAMWQSGDDLEKGNFGIILERMQDAVSISLKRELGWDIFGEEFLKRLELALSSQKTISTGIAALDKHLSGGFARQQFTLFTANSGAGKSVMLNNLAHNYAVRGYHTVLLSLELPREMIFTRSSAITSGYNVKTLKENMIEVADTVDSVRSKTDGSLIIERIKGDATTNDIRSYLTHYEIELERRPDAVFVDYLDKMTPNRGVGRLSISEQDKYKSEEMAELIYDYNLISASASQQNREAIGNMSPKQDVIAGGLTKINTVDNVISLFMNDQMRLRGEMIAHFLKTRSSDGVGKSEELLFDEHNLRICDPDSSSNHGIFDISKRVDDITKQLPGLEFPEPTTEVAAASNLLNFMEELDSE